MTTWSSGSAKGLFDRSDHRRAIPFLQTAALALPMMVASFFMTRHAVPRASSRHHIPNLLGSRSLERVPGYSEPVEPESPFDRFDSTIAASISSASTLDVRLFCVMKWCNISA
jgi:hypothetical protein